MKPNKSTEWDHFPARQHVAVLSHNAHHRHAQTARCMPIDLVAYEY